jgi:hypothetical protein
VHVKLTTMKAYEQALESIRSEVSFGYETIRVYQAPELESLQVGYSVKPTGESLVGKEDGDWLKKWIVIGCEELCGDPIFIDTSVKGFPVYTAAHGEGRWDPTPVAVSLEGFGKALAVLAQAARGREYAKALEENPLTQPERESVLAAIRNENPGIDLEFWEIVLEPGTKTTKG